MNYYSGAEKHTPIAPMKEIDYRALRLMLERSDGSNFQKKRQITQFDRAWKRGILFYCKEETSFQKWLRAEARFTLGDYTDWSGWQYRNRWAEKNWFNNPFKVPVWDTKPVDHLYIMGEQGLGDEVLFSQCIFNCKPLAKRITVETQERLRGIFERSFEVETVAAIIGADGLRRGKPFEADAWVAVGELPRAFRRFPKDFTRRAYMVPDPQRIPEMEPYRGRIGISWRGAQGTIDLEKLKALYPNALSLQYDQDEEDVEKPHIDLRDDLEGVFALLSVLKKIVTVSTTVAHFAAASGVETEIIIADRGTGIRNSILPWRWLNVSDNQVPRRSVWYGNNVKVFQSWGEAYAYTR